ncbi:MAG: TM2 domain-containing protein [Patescibacteria group bacterium]|nr:TM2 domain-containing protein [Patescibacteria group bacterium]
MAKEVKELNWILTLVLSIFLGQLGVDRFMMGQVGLGILKLITFGGFGIWWLVDVIRIATKSEYKNVKWVE